MTMWYPFGDFDRTFATLDQLRRQFDRAFREVEEGHVPWETSFGGPRLNLYDSGGELTLQAEVPGMTQKDIQLTATQETLTINGERKSDAPKDYSVHRQERAAISFSRSLTLPCKIDLEKVVASVKNGVLTINMAKAPESQPRQITVKAM